MSAYSKGNHANGSKEFCPKACNFEGYLGWFLSLICGFCCLVVVWCVFEFFGGCFGQVVCRGFFEWLLYVVFTLFGGTLTCIYHFKYYLVFLIVVSILCGKIRAFDVCLLKCEFNKFGCLSVYK